MPPKTKKLVKPTEPQVDEFGYKDVTDTADAPTETQLDSWLDTDDFEAPWMAVVQPNEEILFDIDISSVEMVYTDAPADWTQREGSDGKVKQYSAEMKNIMKGERLQALDGRHLVPFWACREFKQTIKLSKKRGGWTEMGYERRTELRNGKTYNEAFFGISE